MNQKSNLISPRLLQVNSEATEVFTNYNADLDRISNDIKFVDENSQKVGLPFSFYFVIETEDLQYFVDEPGFGRHQRAYYVDVKDTCLSWEKCPQGNYRLCHNISTTVFAIENPENDWRTKPHKKIKTESIIKPLIETKAHVRFKVDPFISEFYEALVSALKKYRAKDLVIEYVWRELTSIPAGIEPDQTLVPHKT